MRVFPFFISFFSLNEIKKKSSRKEDTRQMDADKLFFTEVTETRVSDHYTRNIYT